MKDAQPLKGPYYVCIDGPAGELRVFRREVEKLPGWSLHERDGAIYVAKGDAGAGDTPSAADARAKRLILNISRATMLSGLDPLPGLKCGGYFRVGEDGKRQLGIVGETGKYGITLSPLRLEAYGVVSGPGVEAAPATDPMIGRMEALEALDGSEAVETLLHLFEVERDRFGTLFNILERVRAALRSDIPREWISNAKLELLERTANHDKAGGLTARHHAADTEPPANPMPLAEAQDHVRRILDQLVRRMADGAEEQQCAPKE